MAVSILFRLAVVAAAALVATEVQFPQRAQHSAVLVVLHFLQAVQVQLEVMPVDLAVVVLETGVTTQVVAAAADTQVVREVSSAEAAAEVVLTTMDLHKQILQLQTMQQDL
jgi:hypothetical protein